MPSPSSSCRGGGGRDVAQCRQQQRCCAVAAAAGGLRAGAGCEHGGRGGRAGRAGARRTRAQRRRRDRGRTEAAAPAATGRRCPKLRRQTGAVVGRVLPRVLQGKEQSPASRGFSLATLALTISEDRREPPGSVDSGCVEHRVGAG